MVDEQVRREALDLIHMMQATAETQEIEEADSFIVSALTPETRHQGFVGPFDEWVEALQFAQKWAVELNSGNSPDEIPFTTSVHPMFDPDR